MLPVWDPYYNIDIYKLEKVQRRAARCISSEYYRTTYQCYIIVVYSKYAYITTASSIIKTIRFFYKIINSALSIYTLPHYQRTQFRTTQHHPNQFILPQATLTLTSIVFIQELLKTGIIRTYINIIESRDLDEFDLTIIDCRVRMYDCTIWGFHP